MKTENDEEYLLASYLDSTANIENTCKFVSDARMRSLKFLSSTNVYNTRFLTPELTSLDYPIGSFVAYIGKWKLFKDMTYLTDKNYIHVEMTNGEEFSEHHFPLKYLLFNRQQIEEAEAIVYKQMAKYRDEHLKIEKQKEDLAIQSYEKAAKEKELKLYLELKLKFEGDNNGN